MKKNTFLILLYLCSIKVNAQNIGIGTLTPTKKLQVVGNLFVSDSLGIAVQKPFYKLDVGGRMRLYSGGSADNTAGFWLNKKSNSAFGAFVGMESNNIIGIFSPSTSWSMGMNTDNGNVGFGNVNPIFKLDVTGKIRIRSGGSENSSAGFWLNNNTNNSPAAFTGMFSDDRMGIFSETLQNWPLMINVNNGNVGIGNNNPTEKLEVTGDVNATGIIAAAGNFVVGLEYRVVNFDVADNSSPTVDCNCPPGKTAIGGGGGHKDVNLGQTTISIISSFPTLDGTGWRIKFTNRGTDFTSGPKACQVWAICAKVR
jgi:hypothetical protein